MKKPYPFILFTAFVFWATLFTTGPAKALTLFQDDFSGVSTDSLNGTTPDVTTDASAWVASAQYSANGTVSSGNENHRAYLALGDTIDDNRGQSDALYTLDVTLNVSSSDTTSWEALGFWTDAAPSGNFYSKNGVAWMLRRANAELRVFRGLSTADTLTESTGSPNNTAGTVDLQVVLDLTTWDGSSNWGTVTYSAKLSAETTYTEIATGALDASNSSFRSVGIGGGDIAASVSWFELSQDVAPIQLSISHGDSGFDFDWNSKTGKTYELLSSTNLSTATDTWPAYDPNDDGSYTNIASQGSTTTLAEVPSEDSIRFFALTEKDSATESVSEDNEDIVTTEIAVENLGVSGQNSSEGLAGFSSKLTSNPDHVVIYYGMNDALNSAKLIALSTYTNNLISMVEQAVDAGAKNVFLVNIHPVNTTYLAARHSYAFDDIQAHLTEYNEAVAEVTATTAATLIDWRTAFLGGSTIEAATANAVDCLLICQANSENENNTSFDDASEYEDGVHLTAAGYQLLGETVLSAVQSVAQAGDIVTCIGDSITYGLKADGAGTITGDTYPAVLYDGLNP